MKEITPRRFLTCTLIALVLTLVVKTYIVDWSFIVGSSMAPGLHTGNSALVLKNFYTLERGNIVILIDPVESDKILIKRVIGLPGDELFISSMGHVVILNGSQPLEEPYAIFGNDEVSVLSGILVKVPEASYWVMGDNRPVSMDSRSFGFVPVKLIRGKVIYIF